MRTLIHWDKSYDTGIKEIDQQHHKLIDIINLIYESIIAQKPDEIIEQAFNDLRDYSFIHFNSEHKYINLLHEPEKEIHLNEHQEFIKKINQFQQEFSSREKPSQQMIDYLKTWLVDHIVKKDGKYAEKYRNF